MGISTRKDDQRAAALAWEKAAAAKRDAEKIVAEWNKQLADQTPMLFVPTIGAALLSGHHWLVVRPMTLPEADDQPRSMRDVSVRERRGAIGLAHACPIK